MVIFKELDGEGRNEIAIDKIESFFSGLKNWQAEDKGAQNK